MERKGERKDGERKKNEIDEGDLIEINEPKQNRMSTTFPQLPPYFGKGPTVIPQRSAYLAGVCSMVSVFNPR